MYVHCSVFNCGVLLLVSWTATLAACQETTNIEPIDGRTLTNSVGMKFVLIPAGTYEMGSPADESGRWDIEHLHPVTITQPFLMAVHEVTQAHFEQVMGFNPSHFAPSGSRADDVQRIDTKQFPVEGVSFADALEFCTRLSCQPQEMQAGRMYRLPTEAEWEWACRGGKSGQPFSFGHSLSSRQANILGMQPYGDAQRGPDLKRPTTVGSYAPNAFGLFDMHGNVAEWCFDRYDRDYYLKSPRDDPQGRLDGKDGCRVVRGGHWNLSGNAARAAQRAPRPPLNLPRTQWRSEYLGFRVVCVTRTAPGHDNASTPPSRPVDGPESNSDYRIWTSSRGTTKTARLISWHDEDVHLEFQDGTDKKLKLQHLSDDDRAYLAAARGKAVSGADDRLQAHGFELKGRYIRYQGEKAIKAGLRDLAEGENEIEKIEKQLTRKAEDSYRLDQERFRLRQLYIETQKRMENVPPRSTNERNRVVGILNSINAQIESLELNAQTLQKQADSLRGSLAQARNDYLLAATKIKRELSSFKLAMLDFDRLQLQNQVQSVVQPFVGQVTLSPPLHANRRDNLLVELDRSVLSDRIPLRVSGNTRYATVNINGKPVEMILDTGASLVMIPAQVAARIGITPQPHDPDIQLSVADGNIIIAKLVRVDAMQLGPFQVKQVQCAVLSPDEREPVPLLGMSFLNHFQMKLQHDVVELTRVSPTAPRSTDQR